VTPFISVAAAPAFKVANHWLLLRPLTVAIATGVLLVEGRIATFLYVLGSETGHINRPITSLKLLVGLYAAAQQDDPEKRSKHMGQGQGRSGSVASKLLQAAVMKQQCSTLWSLFMNTLHLR
jgi:hypothetical protein